MMTILALGRPTHGTPASERVMAFREYLPDATVCRPKTTTETLDAATDAAIIMSMSLFDEVLDAADELRLLAGMTVGYDHLPLETSRGRGAHVTNTFGVHDPNITEHAVGWLLMITRQLNEGLRHQ